MINDTLTPRRAPRRRARELRLTPIEQDRAVGAGTIEMSLLAAIIDSTADHIHVKDLRGRYVLVNRADATWFGRAPEDILGLTDADLIDAEAAAVVVARDRAVIETGRPIEYEQTVVFGGHDRTWLTTKNVVRGPTGQVIGLFTISHEITEQLRQEAQLRQAAKMEAVGQLAGGIAHDFNNILTTIRGYADLARQSLPALDDRTSADLGEVIMAADRATELTRQLLAFSRRQVLAPRVLDPGGILTAMAPLLRRLLGEHIELGIRTQSDAGQVRVDATQLEQVILNLAVNARDAMPHGGRLTVETGAAELDDEYARTHPGTSPGPHVRLTVTDTGMGMDAATRDRIFEPFFTTKGLGKGTGLGLATVYGVMNQAGGSIHVYSEPGYGTTFQAYFPRVDTQPAEQHAAPESAAVPSGRETILLVEDERAVRGYAQRVLTSLGYTVLEAANGADAIALAGRHGAIELLLTDVIMPGMQGAALAAELTAIRPELRTLFVSGFPEDSIVRNGVLAGEVAYLPKPFSAASLARAVRHTIDAGPTREVG